MNNTTGNINSPRSGYTGTQRIVVSDAQYAVTEHDGGSLIRMTAAAGSQFVLLGANVGAGFCVDVVREGAGSTIAFNATDPGVTVRSRGDRTELNGQYAKARATCIAPGEWVLDGDLTAGG